MERYHPAEPHLPYRPNLQEAAYQLSPKDVLRPKIEYKGGSLKFQTGEQFLGQFGKRFTDASGTLVAVQFAWLCVVNCFSTGEKPWLLYRIFGSALAAKAR